MNWLAQQREQMSMPRVDALASRGISAKEELVKRK
jgi:hypothetical protein